MELIRRDQMITVNGSNICYDDYGAGKMSVIFIHGFPFDKSSWQPQMEFFKKKYRVIAFDIRGFGKSICGDEEKSIKLFADDLVAFMDALQIEKSIVCGLSMGGYILLNALNRYPERFEAIVLCDTQCIADSPEVKKKRMDTIDNIKKDGIDNFTEAFIKSVFYSETLNHQNELVDRIRNVIYNTSNNTIVSGLNALAERVEMCSTLSKIAVPTLIICGKEDTVTPLAQSELLQQTIKNSEMVVISKAGHLSNLEQPDIFNSELNNFILRIYKQNLK